MKKGFPVPVCLLCHRLEEGNFPNVNTFTNFVSQRWKVKHSFHFLEATHHLFFTSQENVETFASIYPSKCPLRYNWHWWYSYYAKFMELIINGNSHSKKKFAFQEKIRIPRKNCFNPTLKLLLWWTMWLDGWLGSYCFAVNTLSTYQYMCLPFH